MASSICGYLFLSYFFARKMPFSHRVSAFNGFCCLGLCFCVGVTINKRFLLQLFADDAHNPVLWSQRL